MAVQGADLAKEVQVSAFESAVRLLANADAAGVDPAHRSSGGDQDLTHAGSQQSAGLDGQLSETEFIASLALKCDVPGDRLARVFAIHDGIVQLLVPERRLGADSASVFRNVATLFVPAIVVHEKLESVDASRLKDAGVARGAVDGGNYAKYVRNIPGYSYLGAPRQKVFKLTPGWQDTFTAAVDAALSDGSK